MNATRIPGLILIEPQVFRDSRGFFYESYNERRFAELGISARFCQDNQSFSTQGVLRGLHFQRPPMAQAKLVRAIRGSVLDVAVDIRNGSSTFGLWDSVILSEQNKRQFFIPKGFAHGFLVLSDVAEVAYKCDEYYSPSHEDGLRFDDPALAIDWGERVSELLLSEKDLKWPSLRSRQAVFEA